MKKSNSEPLRAGWLKRTGKLKASRRWVVLTASGCQYSKSPESSPLGYFDCSDIISVEALQDEKELWLEVRAKQKTYVFTADTAADRDAWLEAFGGASQCPPKLISSEQHKAQKNHRAFNLVLLGIGGAGKTTVVAQMVSSFGPKGYDKEARLAYREVIWRNMRDAMSVLVAAAQTSQNCEISQRSLETWSKVASAKRFSRDALIQLQSMWQDEAIVSAFHAKHLVEMSDSASYYRQRLPEMIRQETYLPTDDDILRSRQRTRGIKELTFSFRKAFYHVYDAGGQRKERNQHWGQVAQLCSARRTFMVIYVVAISEYDEVVKDDVSSQANSLQEAIATFADVVKSKAFSQADHLVVFLNKFDLFKQKIQSVGLEKCFKDYKGRKGDVDAALNFIKAKFRDVTKNCEFHETVAIDPKEMQRLLENLIDLTKLEQIQ